MELSDEERAAVERLGALGFPFAACLEAFLICDRNEALAANYLLVRREGGRGAECASRGDIGD